VPPPPDAESAAGPDDGEPVGFLGFAQVALDRTQERLPDTDRDAMALVLLLHRVANSLVYDLESAVHRPAGWSWSAFRLLFTLWVAGAQDPSRAAELTGMSRAAVSALAKTLGVAGLLVRTPDPNDRRSVTLSLSDAGVRRLEETFAIHNRREAEWAGLLTADELTVLIGLLGKLADAAQGQTWVNRRF